MPASSTCERTVSRVVPAIGVTIATSSPASRLRRLDLPTFGRPTSTIESPARSAAPARPRSTMLSSRSAHPGEPSVRVGSAQEIDVLVGKVECRLGERSQLDQRLDLGADRARELPRQAARRSPGRGRRRRVDQVGHTLGLREVELAVEERAQRELARLGEPRPELDAAGEQEPQHRRPPVAVQFDDVLAGVGLRRRKVECEPLVDDRPGAVAERRERRHPRREGPAGKRRHELRHPGARHPDDADAAAPRRGGDRGDRVGGVHRACRPGSEPRRRAALPRAWP